MIYFSRDNCFFFPKKQTYLKEGNESEAQKRKKELTKMKNTIQTSGSANKERGEREYQEKKEKRQRGREHQEAEKNKGAFGSEASQRG